MGARAEDGRWLVVAHDQVGVLGGTERVVEAVLHRYPAARAIALRFGDSDGYPPPWWEARLDTVRGGRRRRHVLSPLYARRIARLRTEARVVLAVPGGGWSLAAHVSPGARLVAYTSGVPRWLHGEPSSYFDAYPRALRPALWASLPALRRRFGRLLARPDRLLTNSRYSATLIRERYGLEAEVVHPPVRTNFFTPGRGERTHVLAVARLVRHKRLHVLVDAFRHLAERLVVVGGGPELERLRAAAPSNVDFTGVVDDGELLDLYRRSRLVVVPSVEEFGIVAAEAQACGVPVVSALEGAAPEVVVDGTTGLLVEQVTGRTLCTAVRAALQQEFDPERCRASALRFSEDVFVSAIERLVDEELAASTQPLPRAAPRRARARLAAASPPPR